MMQPWSADAKLGSFSHWSIYAVNGILESGAFFSGGIPYDEAIYDTIAGLPHGHLYGSCTLSKDRQTPYVFFFDRIMDGFAVKGIHNGIECISVVSSGDELSRRKNGDAACMTLLGVVWIDVPESARDANVTVLKIELDGPLDSYSGSGNAIEQN